MGDLISVIIRTKNEEKWIGACLQAVFEQQDCSYEVIVVDDRSEDRTLDIVSQFPVKIINYDKPYFPGLSLNTGIRASKGDYIACLSGHCVPVHPMWLKNLRRNFEDPDVAAVYGRQEPLPYSSDRDKRDLWTVFGLDRKVQKRDSFFHNANSMLKRDLWERKPFDEKTTNIEDRIWGRAIIDEGYFIVYEPEASVYHWHGIHQDGNKERLKNVVRIVESLNLVESSQIAQQNGKQLLITAIIPKKGDSIQINERRLIEYTIERAMESTLIDNVIVSTDSEATANLAKSLGAEAPFLRPKELSYDYVGLNRVMSYTISQLKVLKQYPDIVVILQETHPFRETGFLDTLIKEMLYTGVDTLIPVYEDYNIFYKQDKEEIVSIDSGFIPQKLKEPLLAGMPGLGVVIKTQYLEEEQLTGQNIGVFPVESRPCSIEIQKQNDVKYFAQVLDTFWRQNE